MDAVGVSFGESIKILLQKVLIEYWASRPNPPYFFTHRLFVFYGVRENASLSFLMKKVSKKSRLHFFLSALWAELFSLVNLRPLGRFPSELPQWCPQFTA